MTSQRARKPKRHWPSANSGSAQSSEQEARARGDVLAERRFRKLIEHAPDAILKVDTARKIVVANNTAMSMFGYTREELLGSNVDLLVPEAKRTAHAEHRKGICGRRCQQTHGSRTGSSRTPEGPITKAVMMADLLKITPHPQRMFGSFCGVTNTAGKADLHPLGEFKHVLQLLLNLLVCRSDRIRICFTIDDFDQVGTDMCLGYQSAETERLAKDRPRSKVTSKAALAESLNKGDKLLVVSLLENN